MVGADGTDRGLFVYAAEFLYRRLAADKAEQSNERLFQGSAAEMQERWGCSAVKLNDGSWCVVPRNECVRASDGCVRLASGGTLRGRLQWRNAAWFQENVECAMLGALVLGDGAGSNSSFGQGGEGEAQLVLREPAEAPSDGRWRVEHVLGDERQELELSVALVQMGAARVRFGAAAGEEEVPVADATVSLVRRAAPSDIDGLITATGPNCV